MDSAELSRKVAAAMGWRKCERPRPAWDEDIWHPAQDPTECSENCCPVPLLDLADARDREAAIAWWKTKTGGRVSIMWLSATVAVWFHPPDTRQPIFSAECPTIEEAFGRAFLKAVGVQG